MMVYETSKPSSLPLTVVWISPLLLWLRVGGKLAGDPQIDQPTCWGCSQEPCFSGVVTLSNSVDISQKVVIREPREIRMVKDHTWTEHEKRVACWSDFSLQGVHRFESPRLLDMSITCLWQSSRSNLMSLMKMLL
jgi:hypothetical protein